MERNTILAIVLSISVLLIYDMFVAAPQRAKAVKEVKVINNQEVVENSSIKTKISPITTNNEESSTIKVEKGQESNFNQKNYIISSNNVGASLHKVKFLTAAHEMPIFDALNIVGLEQQNFVLVSKNDNTVVYKLKTSSLEILKEFEFKENQIFSRLEILRDDDGILKNPKFLAFAIDSSRLETSNKRETMLDEYSVRVNGKIFRKGGAAKFSPKESKMFEGQASWVAFRDHYHSFVVKPLFDTKVVDIKQVTEQKLDILIQAKQDKKVYDFIIYSGFQNKELMGKIDKDFSTVLAFSSFYPIELIAQAIYHLTQWVQMVVKSWGISIILMSILVYGITYPLTIKNMVSMRRMQAMQPKINALKERFKNDPQKLNAEIVEIYRREKINPLGGCLPMLLQMPFFMAIYQVLWRAYYFQGKSFLWIKDLSQADKIFILPFSLPFIGNEFNILPVVMGGVMFWQQRLTAQSTVITDESQAMQQKMMTTIFPIFIAVIFYKFASSLSLYFTMFYLFSAITQYKMNHTLKELK